MPRPFTEFVHEHYRCDRCQKNIPAGEVPDSWRCDTCSTPISIYAKDRKNSHHVVCRVPAREIRAGYSLVVLSANFDFVHSVIANRQEGRFFFIALAGHGTIKRSSEQMVSCVIGSWDENNNELYRR